MDDTLLMRNFESLGNLQGQFQGFLNRDRTALQLICKCRGQYLNGVY